MKASIIVFSPSGHTLKVAERIKFKLKENDAEVQLINITKDEDYLSSNTVKAKLEKELDAHDILFIGGPLYAGHIERNVMQLMKQLPNSNEKYGKFAVPFVTYGGVHTSIALEEMGKLFKKSGRTSVLGIKIAAEHTLTKTFDKFINEGKPNEDDLKIVDQAVGKILQLTESSPLDIEDASKALCYSSAKERLLFHTLSQEFFHKKHKDVSIDKEKCIGCKKCVAVCPVNMYSATSKTIKMNPDSSKCILCAECIHNCPSDAIAFSYLKKVKARLKDGHTKLEQPQSKIYM